MSSFQIVIFMIGMDTTAPTTAQTRHGKHRVVYHVMTGKPQPKSTTITVYPLTIDWMKTSYVKQLAPWVLKLFSRSTSAKCKSVRKPHPNLPDTPVALTSASMYFKMLPGPPGALQSALKLCKRIISCSWKHLQLWMCIQDAMRLDYLDSQI